MTRLRAHLGGKRCVFFLFCEGSREREKKEYEDFFFRARDEVFACLLVLLALPCLRDGHFVRHGGYRFSILLFC